MVEVGEPGVEGRKHVVCPVAGLARRREGVAFRRLLAVDAGGVLGLLLLWHWPQSTLASLSG